MKRNSTIARKSPICPGSLLVKEARDLHLAANGFRVEGYDTPIFTIGIFGVLFKFPNIPSRKHAISLPNPGAVEYLVDKAR